MTAHGYLCASLCVPKTQNIHDRLQVRNFFQGEPSAHAPGRLRRRRSREIAEGHTRSQARSAHRDIRPFSRGRRRRRRRQTFVRTRRAGGRARRVTDTCTNRIDRLYSLCPCSHSRSLRACMMAMIGVIGRRRERCGEESRMPGTEVETRKGALLLRLNNAVPFRSNIHVSYFLLRTVPGSMDSVRMESEGTESERTFSFSLILHRIH